MFVLLVCMLYRFLPHGTGKKEKSRNKKRAKHTSLRMEKGAFTWSFVLGMAFAEGSANDWLPIVMVDGHEQSVVTGSIMYTILYWQ